MRFINPRDMFKPIRLGGRRHYCELGTTSYWRGYKANLSHLVRNGKKFKIAVLCLSVSSLWGTQYHVVSHTRLLPRLRQLAVRPMKFGRHIWLLEICVASPCGFSCPRRDLVRLRAYSLLVFREVVSRGSKRPSDGRL
jgi:hypothetical protein